MIQRDSLKYIFATSFNMYGYHDRSFHFWKPFGDLYYGLGAYYYLNKKLGDLVVEEGSRLPRFWFIYLRFG
jgi:hypothetical protein